MLTLNGENSEGAKIFTSLLPSEKKLNLFQKLDYQSFCDFLNSKLFK